MCPWERSREPGDGVGPTLSISGRFLEVEQDGFRPPSSVARSPSTWALKTCASVWWSWGCLLYRRSAVTQRVRFPEQKVLAVTGGGNCLYLLLQWGIGTTVGAVKPAGATRAAWEEEPGVEGDWG